MSSITDKVIAVRYKAQGESKLNLQFSYKPGSDINASTPKYSESTASFGGKLTTVTYNSTFKVIGDNDAVISATSEGINVSNSSEIVLIISALTDYNPNSATCKG